MNTNSSKLHKSFRKYETFVQPGYLITDIQLQLFQLYHQNSKTLRGVRCLLIELDFFSHFFCENIIEDIFIFTYSA